MNLRTTVKWLSLLIATGLVSIVACKARQSRSSEKDAILPEYRNQGQNGSCWLYAAGTMLNGTLARANMRLIIKEMGGKIDDPLAFALPKENGSPMSVSDYLRLFRGNNGLFNSRVLDMIARFQSTKDESTKKAYSAMILENGRADGEWNKAYLWALRNGGAKHVPFISINALIYAYYLQAFENWSQSWWPSTFDGDGGGADKFNVIYKKALFPNQLFPDRDSSTADNEMAKSICKNASNCSPGNITDLINTAGVSKKSPSDQQKFFHDVIESAYAVPGPFQVALEGNLMSGQRLRFPVLEDDFKFQFRDKFYTRKTIHEAFYLPADIGLVRWRSDISPNLPSFAAFKERWQVSQSSPLSAKALVEIVAVLLILNQPVEIDLVPFVVKAIPKQNSEWDFAAQPEKPIGHGLVAESFEVRDDELGLLLRNSYGYGNDSTIRAFGLTKGAWGVTLPGFILDRIAKNFGIAASGKCELIDDEVKVFGAAYVYLRDQKNSADGKLTRYTEFSTLGQTMLAYMDKCGGKIDNLR